MDVYALAFSICVIFLAIILCFRFIYKHYRLQKKWNHAHAEKMSNIEQQINKLNRSETVIFECPSDSDFDFSVEKES